LTSLFVLARALDDDYVDDSYFLTDGIIKSTDEYPLLAAQLNCSEFIVRHEGVKIAEVLSKPNRLKAKIKEIMKTPYVEDTDGNPENEATEKPVRSKRAAVIIERFWTAKNISIIDGYSKVAVYPMPDHKHIKREIAAEKATLENETTDCTAAFDDDGEMFNWYKVRLDESYCLELNPNVRSV